MSKVKIQGNASGTGIFTVAAPATNTDRTLTLPDTSSTLLAPDSTGSIQLDYAGSNNYLNFISSANYVGRNASTGDIWLNAQGGQGVILGIGGTSQLKVDGNGRVLTPNQPMFSGKLSNGTVPGSSARITTITVDINVGNNWNGSTGLFTCPVAGKYLVSSTVMKNAGAGQVIHVDIYKNGSWLGNYRNRLSDSSNYQQSSLTTIVDCAANDTLEFQWFGGCNALTTHDAFLIHLLG